MAFISLANISRRAENNGKLPAIPELTVTMCAAIFNAATQTVNDTQSLENIEQTFLSSLSFRGLLGALEINGVWRWIQDLVARRFAIKISMPTAAEMPGKRSRRVGLALIKRMVETSMLEMADASNEFIFNKRRASAAYRRYWKGTWLSPSKKYCCCFCFRSRK